ncbi:MAG: bifunctional adenosylcobinamide kinase/adenosylcobinamide-phosphate guanylyltransferase [bacterium]
MPITLPQNLQDKGRRIVLVLGGARSGKSAYAQTLAEQMWKHPLYLATAETLDREMADRVKLHRAQRGLHWGCAEETLDVARLILAPAPPRDGVLLDCATLWLTNVLLKEGEPTVRPRQDELITALKTSPTGVIIVSNEVGMGIVPETPLGRKFRDLQGRLNQDLAIIADSVVFVIAGIPMAIKGRI